MTLLLHANAANYNEFLDSQNATQFGERGTGSLVVTPEARDPGSSYIGLGAVDVFEVWADVARHYRATVDVVRHRDTLVVPLRARPAPSPPPPRPEDVPDART